ncbi:hypothetical protein [Bacillus cereus]|uniref:hypothetical protein n=1 Tax=Bacillus cereus TaxID=1396 RepID=UPI000BF59F51|nr:hypothetical protein [Bacillus cereus]PFN22319.1 hypothetical protein COJ69_12080 [Bacillus cereus]
MADYFLKHGKKYYKKNDRPCNSSNSDSNNCFIQNYTIFGTGNTPQDLDITTGIPRTVFENFTKNHNKTLIKFSFSPAFATTIRLTIARLNHRSPLTFTLTPGDIKTFLVEDVESITFSDTVAPSTLNLLIQQTNCICCSNSNNDESYYYNSCNDAY